MIRPKHAQTIKAKQLAKPIFEFRALEPALLAGITSLDLRGADAQSFAAAALALEDLPSLRRITFPQDLLSSVAEGDCDANGLQIPDAVARREFATQAFQDFAGRVTDVQVVKIWSYGYRAVSLRGNIESFASLDTVRRLVLHPNTRVFEPNGQGMAELLSSMSRLEELEIADEDAEQSFASTLYVPAWKNSVRLAALRSFAVNTADAKVLAFVSRIAPNLEALDITVPEYARIDAPREDKEVVSLPSLRRLRIAGPAHGGLLLTHVRLAPLTSLEICIDTSPTGSAVDCGELLPERVALPHGLRLYLEVHCLVTVENFAALEARCSEAGVALTRKEHSSLAAFSPPMRARGQAASQARFAAVARTLDWAKERVEKLWEEEDTDGVQEMCEALRQVAERNLLETR